MIMTYLTRHELGEIWLLVRYIEYTLENARMNESVRKDLEGRIDKIKNIIKSAAGDVIEAEFY